MRLYVFFVKCGSRLVPCLMNQERLQLDCRKVYRHEVLQKVTLKQKENTHKHRNKKAKMKKVCRTKERVLKAWLPLKRKEKKQKDVLLGLGLCTWWRREKRLVLSTTKLSLSILSLVHVSVWWRFGMTGCGSHVSTLPLVVWGTQDMKIKQ